MLFAKEKMMLTQNRRYFAKNLMALASTCITTASLTALAQKHKTPALTADQWMRGWMQTPQHGDTKTQGEGGMLSITRFADPFYFLASPIQWAPDQGQTYKAFTLPTGFVTDLASIPRPLWSGWRPDGNYAYAAVLHDYLYWVQNVPKAEADDILRIVMTDFGVGSATVNGIYEGVHLGGQSAWDDNARRKSRGESRFLRTVPTSPTTKWERWRQDPLHLLPNPA